MKHRIRTALKAKIKQKAKKKILGAGLALGLGLLFSSATALASPTLKTGSSGQEVIILQQKLAEIGYAVGSVDGVYGNDTERAVASFQRDQKIRITGIVNNATWRALKKAKPLPGAKKPAPTTPRLPSTKKPTTPLVPNGTPILPKAKTSAIISTAKKYIGTPYKFGGTTPKAFDCSGYLQYVFAEQGINIPRLADEQYRLGLRTKTQKELVPGDLVFFTTYEPGPSHCGIYLGDGNFIHASTSKGVRIDSLSNSYWAPRYIGGKHIVK